MSNDTPPQGNRIREVRKSQGLTMQELADRAGVHFTTIAKIERSMRKLSGEMLARIAAGLRVSPSDLVDGAPFVPVRMVPLLGTISAGTWKQATQEAEAFVPAPYGGAAAFALRPDGDSMDMIVAPDAIIIVDPDDFELKEGRIYAVGREDGDTTFKRFRLDPPRLEPCSTNPAHKPIILGREPITVIGRVVWQGSQTLVTSQTAKLLVARH